MACLGIVLWLAAPALADNPVAGLFGNSLLCRASATGGVCDLWVKQNGRYAVFYDSGKPAFVTGVGGAFRYEGREGSYTAHATPGGISLCLTPDDLAPTARFSRAPHLFHEAGCVDLPRLQAGQVAALGYLGQQYTLALVKGR